MYVVSKPHIYMLGLVQQSDYCLREKATYNFRLKDLITFSYAFADDFAALGGENMLSFRKGSKLL